MATYKVLQDIESEDKLFGPFTLKQFIFGALTILIGFIGFRVLILGIPIFVKLPVIAVLLPFFIVLGFLAAPLGRDQPNDVWLFAQLRYFFKPRRRIWDQDGMSDLVTITAPKRDNHVYTNSFTQTEVKSRLSALANTLDSRGWAVKNVNANMFAQPGYLTDAVGSDRLVSPSELPQDVSITDVTAADDILDPSANSTAQHLDLLVQQSTATVKQQAVSNMSSAGNPTPAAPASAQDYWFMNQPQAPAATLPPDFATFSNQQVVTPGTSDAVQPAESTAEEEAFARKLTEEKQEANKHIVDHMKVLQPLHDHDGNIIKQEPAPVAPISPAIQTLAQNNDLNLSTLSREANRIIKKEDMPSDGEVTISLH